MGVVICGICREAVREIVLRDGSRMALCERCWDMQLVPFGGGGSGVSYEGHRV